MKDTFVSRPSVTIIITSQSSSVWATMSSSKGGYDRRNAVEVKGGERAGRTISRVGGGVAGPRDEQGLRDRGIRGCDVLDSVLLM